MTRSFREWFDNAVWIILFLLLVPSAFAIASWNSLPGSGLFRIKLTMEQALVFLVPSVEAKGNLQIAFTERRFSEAKRLISDQTSVQGLSYLDNQVDVTKQAILTTRDPALKRQLAQKYVTSLRDVSSQLEQQKQIAVASAPSGSRVSVTTGTNEAQPVITRAPTLTPTPYVPPPPGALPVIQVTPTSTRAPTPTPFVPPPTTEIPATKTEVIASISQSQQNMLEAIEQMQDQLDEGPGNSMFGQGQGQGQGQDQGQGPFDSHK